MTRMLPQDLRNLAFCGHGSSGKTTLVDKLLMKFGGVGGLHRVEDGTSFCDFDPEEREHRHTIEAKLTHFEYQGKRFNLIDTPGYPDFLGQTIGALQGVDNAVIVINAHTGIELNTRRVFQEAERAGVGRLILINKLDEENIDFPKLIADLHELWGERCVLFQVPLGVGQAFQGVVSTLDPPAVSPGAVLDPHALHDALVEMAVEVDEERMNAYLEGKPPTRAQLLQLMVKGVATGNLVPIFCCSGKKEIGLTELVEGLAMAAVSPLDLPRYATHGEQTIQLEATSDGPLVARVFKTRIDPFVQKLSFIRVFSGRLHKDDPIHVAPVRKAVKLNALLDVQASETQPIEGAGPGELVATAKMEDLHTGSVLGDYALPAIVYPKPMVGLAVAPKNRGDESKLSGALHKIVEEDPTFRVDHDQQTKELVMTGMSELHLLVIRQRLHRRDKLDIETKEPKIPFRETIQGTAEGSYRHKKQSGGRGQFGEVHLRMMPFPRGMDPHAFCTKERFPHLKAMHYDEKHHFLWIDSIVGGVIPGNFMPAIEKGFKERVETGVLAGYSIQDLCVEVFFGKHHPVDSSEAAFKTAARMAFRQVFQQARPCLLEPIVKLAITVPEVNVGEVYSDMSGHGGRVLGAASAGGHLQTVSAEAPLRIVSHYARTLSSMTGGQGSYSIEFSHYDLVPAAVQQEIIAKSHLTEEEEE